MDERNNVGVEEMMGLRSMCRVIRIERRKNKEVRRRFV